MIKDIKNRHNNVQQWIAMGINELLEKKGIKREAQNDNITFDFGTFLDRFYITR